MYSMLLSLKEFDSYLRGGTSSSLKNYLKFYDARPASLQRDFHLLKITATPEIQHYIHSILKTLDIPKNEWKKFEADLTVYDFLIRLAQHGHPQVDFILNQIDKKSSYSITDWILGSGVLISLGLYLLQQPGFQFVVDGIISFFSSIVSFPIVGFLWNCILFIYYYRESNNDLKKTKFNRYRDNFFLILSYTANGLAYAILIFTSATMSPVIAGLYIASSAIDVLRELFCLVQEHLVYLTSPSFDEHDQLGRYRSEARRLFGFEKRRNALGLNFAAALVIVVITVIWCSLPGGMMATIVSLLAIGIVHLIKLALIKRNEVQLREQLQNNLQTLEDKYGIPDPEYKINSQLQLSNSCDEKQSVSIPRPTLKTSSQFSAGDRPFFASPSAKASNPRNQAIEPNTLRSDLKTPTSDLSTPGSRGLSAGSSE